MGKSVYDTDQLFIEWDNDEDDGVVGEDLPREDKEKLKKIYEKNPELGQEFMEYTDMEIELSTRSPQERMELFEYFVRANEKLAELIRRKK